MKVGLLAYHSACNFGATLQLLSTYMYLKNHHHQPVVINWIPDDLEELYRATTPAPQYQLQQKLRQHIWEETALCRTTDDVATAISNDGIEAVIIGSDAVAQHHPWLEGLVFPCKTMIGFRHYTSDTLFPNPFWADWLTKLRKPIPVAMMSAANQDSAFRLIPRKTRMAMRENMSRFSYVSVRDEWTQQMFCHITKGSCNPPVTPDPVFAFNQNGATLLPSKGDIMRRYSLPDDYILISFHPAVVQSAKAAEAMQHWMDELAALAGNIGWATVSLPFSQCNCFGRCSLAIQHPLSPIDWYALIKYSKGYVGNNMHPIVVSLHNSNPFYSFDNYGTPHLNGLYVDDSTSKIKHLLTAAGYETHCTACASRHFPMPSPATVMESLQKFDSGQCQLFADRQLQRYNQMMDDIMQTICP
ncbi:MAG: polysaccharide pyruvyl transferase family protein [Prevotella sp.]|nr:polysaccharide pyruvyl transferase family protein [Prevotella sp.]